MSKITVFWDATLWNDKWLTLAETKAIEPNHINLALIRERNDAQKQW
jgi:hypothetical protein